MILFSVFLGMDVVIICCVIDIIYVDIEDEVM